MYYIVESDEQLRKLDERGYKNCYVNVVWNNDATHEKLATPLLIYYRPLEGKKSYFLCVNHTETMSIDVVKIKEFLNKHESIYVQNKKSFTYFMQHENILDVNFIKILKNNHQLELPTENSIFNIFSHKRLYDVNKIIPISKHYERENNNWEVIKKYVNNPVIHTEEYKFYNETFTNVFKHIESNGIKLNKEIFDKHFNVLDERNSIKNNFIYTKYNLYTTTSRPSNAFNGVNFTALNKTDGSREAFVTSQDTLLEFDYDGYHIRLIGDLVGYEFNDDSVHTQLGKVYFNKETLDEEEYTESKKKTFQIIYGGNHNQMPDSEFFHKYKTLTKSILYNTPKNCKRFSKKITEGFTPFKMLNYYIQSYETYNNVVVLDKLINYLSTKKSKITAYNYDAFLIDFNAKDGKKFITEVQTILKNGKFPTKVSFSENYNTLVKIN